MPGVVAVFGGGPVGIMTARRAWVSGAGRVIVIDHLHHRLEFARAHAPAEVYDFREIDDMARPILIGTGPAQRVRARLGSGRPGGPTWRRSGSSHTVAFRRPWAPPLPRNG